MATPDVTGAWLREHASEAVTRSDLRDRCCAALGKGRHYVQGRIAEMMRHGDLPYMPPDIVCAGPPLRLPPDRIEGAVALADSAPGGRVPIAAHIAPPMPISGMVLTEEALRGKIDIFYKARRFLEGVKEGLFYRIDDAAVAAGVPKGSAAQIFGDPRFEAYRGQAVADQRIYIGHPARIAALKQEGILR